MNFPLRTAFTVTQVFKLTLAVMLKIEEQDESKTNQRPVQDLHKG